MSANFTVKDAVAIHGSDPQTLIDSITRHRIYDSVYWKQHCFALNAVGILEKAVELQYIGGCYANQRPTPFLCLLLKMLQIQPESEIILELMKCSDFKYLRALACFYFRLVANSQDIYLELEPYLNDYRKLRVRKSSGEYEITYMDVFIDDLLTKYKCCDIVLSRLSKRSFLEESGKLKGPRISLLQDELESNNNTDTE